MKLNEEQHKEKKLTTIYFNKYKAEEKKKMKLYRVPKNSDRKNLQATHEREIDSFLGKGAFGTCGKRQYKGIDVAAKSYESNVRKTDVLWEASIINLFDHPGLPLLFGVCLEKKPYLMVSQFYGIHGKCITLWGAMESGIIKSLQGSTRIFKEIADALLYVHNKSLLHNDIKGDNILLSTEEHPVLIDFGKCRKICSAKWYKLDEKEKKRYVKEHSHLAPELINGTHCQTYASDVYSYGYLLRQYCKVSVATLGVDNPLKPMSKKCLHKNPNDRPTLHDILHQL